jgi:hypothetical protein
MLSNPARRIDCATTSAGARSPVRVTMRGIGELSHMRASYSVRPSAVARRAAAFSNGVSDGKSATRNTTATVT